MEKYNSSSSFRIGYKSKEMLIPTTMSKMKLNKSSSNSGLKTRREKMLFNKDYSEAYLSDLRKTFSINLDILKNYLKENNNKKIFFDNKIITLLNALIEKKRKRDKMIHQIKEKKSKILIENQINTAKKRKIEEKKYMLREQLKEGEERIDGKEEYTKVLHKKMKEVEIYMHKNTTRLKNKEKKSIYQNFSMFYFIENNNEMVRYKRDINIKIQNLKLDYKKELEENKKIKEEEKNFEQTIDYKSELKMKILNEKYKKKIKLIKLRIDTLKNLKKKLYRKIKILNYEKSNNKNDNNNIINDKIDDYSKTNIEYTNIKNSYMDFSVLNVKNDEDNDISKIKNNFGNIDISIIMPK